MQKFIAVLLMTGVITVAQGQDTSDQTDEMEAGKISNGGQTSLRGLTQLDVTNKADPFKRIPKDQPLC